jgi:hypothetical protein
MPNYAEYFKANRYKATWEMGDRVFGHYEKIPFIGTVGNDTYISDEEGPRVSIHLDLPIHGKSVIIVKPKSIKRLKSYD